MNIAAPVRGPETPQAWTVERLDALDAQWRQRREAARPRHSAAAQQAAWAKSDEAAFLRYTPCPLCGSDDYTVFHPEVCREARGLRQAVVDAAAAVLGRGRAAALASAALRRPVSLVRTHYAVMLCPDCGFLFRNPTYTERGLSRAYDSGGYSTFLSGTYSEHRRKLYGHLYDRMALAERTAGFASRRLLDFGCGYGLFLDFMRSRGWDPHGFDFSSDAVALGRQTFGLERIRSGTLDETTFDQPFDAVSLISVAAHLVDPLDTFGRIHRILRPGGLLLIWTVNAGGFRHRTLLDQWTGFSTNHLVFFDTRSITQALTRCGFARVAFGNDDRTFAALSGRGLIAEADRTALEARFREECLGDMLAVVATNGPG